MNSTLLDKCLAFCQTLASSKTQFKFNLSFGKDIFNFEIKELDKSSCAKKKKSLSQIRRETRRREDFKKKHANMNSESTESPQEAIENTPAPAAPPGSKPAARTCTKCRC